MSAPTESPSTDTPRTDTHCPYCSLQCGITLTPRPNGALELTGRQDFPVNRGGLCVKGATARRAARPPRAPHHAAAAVRRAVRAYWPDRVERTTGIAVPDLTTSSAPWPPPPPR